MNFNHIEPPLYTTNQYSSKTQKLTTNKTSFIKKIESTDKTEITKPTPEKVEAYKKYLEKKYGRVTIQSIGKDNSSLEKAGKSMRGNDVIIAQNILEEMAGNPEKAAYYEQKIDYFFDKVPEDKAYFASIGLTYEPCGVIIHEDGSVTYICGGEDSPERRAKVEAINKAKREKEAARQKENQIRIIQAAMKRKQEMNMLYTKKSMTEFFTAHTFNQTKYINSNILNSQITAYEKNIIEVSKSNNNNLILKS